MGLDRLIATLCLSGVIAMQPDERRTLIRQYAADQITWHEPR